MVEELKTVGRQEINLINPPQLNFESLLNVIEMCIAYSGCWHDEYVLCVAPAPCCTKMTEHL